MEKSFESVLKYEDHNGHYMSQSFICHNWAEYTDNYNPDHVLDMLDYWDWE